MVHMDTVEIKLRNACLKLYRWSNKSRSLIGAFSGDCGNTAEYCMDGLRCP